MDLVKTLERFSLACAPSGYEKEMASLLKNEFEKTCDSVTVDSVGNVIGCISGSEAKQCVMIIAHMDSIGLVIRNITEDGFLLFERLGGVPIKILPGLKVRILNDDGKHIDGVIGHKSHHATSSSEKEKTEDIYSLYIDIGANSASEVKDSGVNVGCFATYRPEFSQLFSTRVSGTSIDNRGGCLALARVAEMCSIIKPSCDLYLVGTVWEEFNLRGAMMAARSIKPDIAIALDVCLTGDTPDMYGRYPIKLSAGPTLTFYNFHGRGTLNGTIAHKGLADLACLTAKQEDISIQRFAAVGMLTDASYLQLEEKGIPVLDMGFPTRYTHTPTEVCDVNDIELLSKLVSAIVRNMDTSFLLDRYKL